jgi:hypothetical protein
MKQGVSCIDIATKSKSEKPICLTCLTAGNHARATKGQTQMAKKTIEQVEASIARWQSRLRRAVNAIERLQKQRKRMAAAKPKPAPKPAPAPMPPHEPEPMPSPVDIGIPDFLQRGVAAQKAVDEIIAEQAEHKRRKSAGRIARMKAKQSGETKRMPLTGKAALDAIRNG